MTAKARRRLGVIAALTVFAVAAGFYTIRSRPVEPPEIDLAGVEPEVAQAVTAARDAVKSDPASAQTWGDLGLVLFAHALYAESRPCFTEAERLAPSDVRWPYYLGLAYLPGDPVSALPCLDRAVAHAGGAVAPRVRRAEVLLGLERWEEARAAFDDAYRRQPDHPRVALGLGHLAARDGAWDRVVALVTPLTDDPTCRQSARALLAEAAARTGDLAAARRHQAALDDLPKDEMWSDPYLETMSRRQVGPQARLRQAATLINLRAYSEAEAILLDLARADPRSVSVHLNLGRLYLAAGDATRAEAALEQTVRLDPRAPVPQFLLGSTRLRLGNPMGAEAAFRAAIVCQPDYAPAHYYLGQCLQQQNDSAGAIDAYRKAVRYRPNLAEAHRELGSALLSSGNRAAARAHLQDALRLQPDDLEAAALLKKAGRR
jgi:tetratricopeptide (TPR) repeat protein